MDPAEGAEHEEDCYVCRGVVDCYRGGGDLDVWWRLVVGRVKWRRDRRGGGREGQGRGDGLRDEHAVTSMLS